MTLRPLGDYVLVHPLPFAEKTEGGLHIPESAKGPDGALHRGKVLAVGQGDKLSSGECAGMQVKPGDTILYWRCPPNEYFEDGQARVVLHEEQSIAAVIG
jgi:chaperonin GroES